MKKKVRRKTRSTGGLYSLTTAGTRARNGRFELTLGAVVALRNTGNVVKHNYLG